MATLLLIHFTNVIFCLEKKIVSKQLVSVQKTPMLILTSFLDNMIDGDALHCLTERGLELLIPQVGKRMKFLKNLDELKSQIKSAEPSEAPTNVVESDHPDYECSSAAVLAEQGLVQAQQQQGSPTPVTEPSKLVPTHFTCHNAPSHYLAPIHI